MNKYIKYTLLFISLLWINISKANETEESVPHLLIQYNDDGLYISPLSNDFKIDNLGEKLLIINKNEDKLIDLSSVKSFGITYKVITAIDSIFEDSQKEWTIYDTNGNLVKKSNQRNPDLTGLQAGKIYIIKNDKLSFKYMPCK